MIVLFFCVAALSSNASAGIDGAALYQKHCIGCHKDRSKLKLAEPLHNSLRVPPPGMPLFNEDKLSDADVRAIGEYIRPGSQQAVEKKAEPEHKEPARQDKPSKEKKSWMKGFGTSDL